MDYKQIVWLSSYPKSGNTWVRCFIDAYLLGEVDINEIITSISDDGAQRALPGDGSDPSKYPIDIQMLTRPMALLRLVREFNGNKTVEVPLFVKTHNAHMCANGIELLPQALTKSVIHIVRDPRDVIVSFAKHMGKTIDEAMEFFFDKYRVINDARNPKLGDFISSWPGHIASYANADTHNIMIVRYEDLKSDPISEFSRILKHSGITPDIERVKKAIEMVGLSKLQAQEKEKGFHESSPHAKNEFFGEGKTGGWEDVLTPKQMNTIEKNCKLMLNRFYIKRKAA